MIGGIRNFFDIEKTEIQNPKEKGITLNVEWATKKPKLISKQ